MSIDKTAPIRVAELRHMISDADARSLALAADLGPDQLAGPRLAVVNPVPWELCHIAWLQERFVLRRGGAAPLITGADDLFDPMVVRHDARWDAPQPGLEAALDYKGRVHDALLSGLDRCDGEMLAGEAATRYRLAVIVEDMRGEAMLHARQALGWTAPAFAAGGAGGEDAAPDAGTLAGDVAVPDGVHMLGAEPGDGFVMDNEEWGHGFEIAPFRIARAAVTNAEFMAFVDDNGYRRAELWSPQGRGWRDYAGADGPAYRVRDGEWKVRMFDRTTPLDPHAPAVNVNWFEADAWCRWAGRRLPSEAEWEVAASRAPVAGADTLRGARRRYPWGDTPPRPEHANLDASRGGPVAVGALADGDSAWGCRQMIGNVWEWTNSIFVPYPGFMPGPYAEYSRPWFETGRAVLRGGSWATRGRQVWNTWRYFHLPERRDIFAGFRTCAV